MKSISRRALILFLIGVQAEEETTQEIGGITRLQKYLFLLEKDYNIEPSDEGFEFEPYKAGPYSPKLYDDLEFLENIGLIESEVSAEATEEEAAEVDRIDFENLMGEIPRTSSGRLAADAYEERRYRLTKRGKEKVEELLQNTNYKQIAEGIRIIKSSFGHYSLSDLLYHVYKKYPDWTVESEIKAKILRRGYR